jgi:uncharacterized protein YjiS (DUF1127 family)
MFDPILQKYRNWRLRAIARRKLALMDDRLLADIGTERDCIGDFVAGKGH